MVCMSFKMYLVHRTRHQSKQDLLHCCTGFFCYMVALVIRPDVALVSGYTISPINP